MDDVILMLDPVIKIRKDSGISKNDIIFAPGAKWELRKMDDVLVERLPDISLMGTEEEKALRDEIERTLAKMGIEFLTYRGCSIGNFGVTPENDKLREVGFLDGGQDEKSGPKGHDYYKMKNWLAQEVQAAILQAASENGIRVHRHTGTLYRDEFGMPIPYNRNNRSRSGELGPWQKVNPRRIDEYVRSLGYNPLSVRETEEGYLVVLSEGEVVTEDIAMTVGCEFKTSVLFNNHRIAPTLGDLTFYAKNHFFWPLPEGWETVVKSTQ